MTKALGELTSQSKEVANTLKNHLPPLTTPTGLAVSVTALRNLRHTFAGSDHVELLDPVASGHEVLAEVLEIDHRSAFKIWNHFRGHSGVENVEDVPEVTPELAQKIRRYFRIDQTP